MSKNVSIFIEKLENGLPPMDNGYIVYNGGFWSGLIWYRYKLESEQWEWTDDLRYWYSVIEQNVNTSQDNMSIINYLRLKSLNKNIKVMSKKMEDVNEIEELVHRLFISYKTLEIPIVAEKYRKDAKVLDYLNQVEFEFNMLDKTIAKLISIEDHFLMERNKIKTRNSQKDFLTSYTNNIIIEKLLILEIRLKVSYLINGLKIRLIELDSRELPNSVLDSRELPNSVLDSRELPNSVLDSRESYKIDQLEADINQVCQFLDKKATYIDNKCIYNIMLHFQTRLLNSLGITVQKNLAMNNEFILDGIQKLKQKNQKNVENIENMNIEFQDKIKKMENIQYVLIKNTDELVKKLKKLEASKKELQFENSELECSLSVHDDDIIKLRNENIDLKLNNKNVIEENTKLKQQIESIISICPDIIYDSNEKKYIKIHDTYDMLDDKL
jgi:hypothetical protein